MKDKVIDINSVKEKKKRIIYPDKNYIISGELAELLVKFTRFYLSAPDIKEHEMEFIGFLTVIIETICREKFNPLETK